jgi:hypothetical protein
LSIHLDGVVESLVVGRVDTHTICVMKFHFSDCVSM